MLTETLKRWLLEHVFTRILFESEYYWKRMFTEKKEWIAESPAGLLFSVTADPATVRMSTWVTGKQSVDSAELVPVALLPPQLPFWDCVLSAFTLFHPELWSTGQHVALSLLKRLREWGYARDQIQNFPPVILHFLEELAAGEKHLHFLYEPVSYTTRMELIFAYGPVSGGFRIEPLPPPRPSKTVRNSIGALAEYYAERRWIKERNDARWAQLEHYLWKNAELMEQLCKEESDSLPMELCGRPEGTVFH